MGGGGLYSLAKYLKAKQKLTFRMTGFSSLCLYQLVMSLYLLHNLFQGRGRFGSESPTIYL